MATEHDGVTNVPDEEKDDTEIVRELIVHLLRIYPILSPTMLQSGLGPYVKPAVWRPVLQDLVDKGIVIEDTETVITPRGRYNTYTKLFLAKAA